MILQCARIGIVVATFFGMLLAHRDVVAGVGPENVIVVVNADSRDSRTVANHYVALRKVPSANVILLTGVPEGLTVSLDDFKSKILVPLLKQLDQRRLAPQARVIAYSAGFPTSVDVSQHTERLTDPDQKKYQLPTASLTGMTYFYQFVLLDSEKYLDWGANLYARGPFIRNFANPFFDEQKRSRFEQAVVSRTAGQHQQAADEFERLFAEAGTLAPLAILAADDYVMAGDPESATRLVEQAVNSGWSSEAYLRQNENLAPLLDTARIQALAPRLNHFPTVSQEPMGFTATTGWTSCGFPGRTMQEGVPYLMSCMLAVVHPRGSTVEQAVDVLQRSAHCDSTFPDGGFWFMHTGDARTNPRFPQMGNALLWLKKAGFEAELIHSAMPTAKSGPCAGLMLGLARIPLEERKWHFVPGAISENLTSLSAQFDTGSQTKITELLHAGAAMTCGPVFEPYNLHFKFPSPLMYGFYAAGTSAIEAFYLSITSPYQVLIVGDPIAQPFATPPSDSVEISATAIEGGVRRVGFVRRQLPVVENSTAARSIEIYVEGRLVQATPAADRIEMSLTEEVTGSIEVRHVLIGGSMIQPRVAHTKWLELPGSTATPEAVWVTDAGFVQLECEGASSITLTHHAETIGTIQGSAGKLSVPFDRLGSGPIRMRPIADFDGRRVPGQPIIVEAD